MNIFLLSCSWHERNIIQSFRCKAHPLRPRKRPQRSISRTFYANNRWLRRPGPWPGAEAVTDWAHEPDFDCDNFGAAYLRSSRQNRHSSVNCKIGSVRIMTNGRMAASAAGPSKSSCCCSCAQTQVLAPSTAVMQPARAPEISPPARSSAARSTSARKPPLSAAPPAWRPAARPGDEGRAVPSAAPLSQSSARLQRSRVGGLRDMTAALPSTAPLSSAMPLTAIVSTGMFFGVCGGGRLPCIDPGPVG